MTENTDPAGPVKESKGTAAQLADTLAGLENSRLLQQATLDREVAAAVEHSALLADELGTLLDSPLLQELEDSPELQAFRARLSQAREVMAHVEKARTAVDQTAALADAVRARDPAAGLAATRELAAAAGIEDVLGEQFEQADTVLEGMETSRQLREAMRERDLVSAVDHAAALLDDVGGLFDPPLQSGLEDNPELLDEIKGSASVLGSIAKGDLAGAFGTVFDQLLQIGIGELLAAGWLEDERLQAMLACDADSDEVTLVPLARHEIAWGYEPEISLEVGGVAVPAAKVRLTLVLVIDCEGLTVVVQRGCARELRSGRLCMHLSIKHGDSTLYDRPTSWIDLKGGLRLDKDGEGIPVTKAALRRAGEASIARLQAAGVTLPPPECNEDDADTEEREGLAEKV